MTVLPRSTDDSECDILVGWSGCKDDHAGVVIVWDSLGVVGGGLTLVASGSAYTAPLINLHQVRVEDVKLVPLNGLGRWVVVTVGSAGHGYLGIAGVCAY